MIGVPLKQTASTAECHDDWLLLFSLWTATASPTGDTTGCDIGLKVGAVPTTGILVFAQPGPVQRGPDLEHNFLARSKRGDRANRVRRRSCA
jgi:hypothetical protein